MVVRIALVAAMLSLVAGTSLAQRDSGGRGSGSAPSIGRGGDGGRGAGGGSSFRGGGGGGGGQAYSRGGSAGGGRVYYRGGGGAPGGRSYSGGGAPSYSGRAYSTWSGRTSSGVRIYQRPRSYGGHGYYGGGHYGGGYYGGGYYGGGYYGGGYYGRGYGYGYPRTYIGLGLDWGVPYYYPYPHHRYVAPYRGAVDVTNEPPPGCYYYDSFCERSFGSLDEYTEHIESMDEHPNTIEILTDDTDARIRTLEFVDGYWEMRR